MEAFVGEFVHERRVEFCDTDAAGIAHFSSLMQYVEQAEHAFLRSLGFSVFTGNADGLTWPRVHVEMDFAGPVRFEETVRISVAVKELGRTSVRYLFRITGPNGPVAKAETVAVSCRKEKLESGEIRLSKVEVPESLRTAFLKHLVS